MRDAACIFLKLRGAHVVHGLLRTSDQQHWALNAADRNVVVLIIPAAPDREWARHCFHSLEPVKRHYVVSGLVCKEHR